MRLQLRLIHVLKFLDDVNFFYKKEMIELNYNWIIDLVIKDAEIHDGVNHSNTPIWFVVIADGVPQPFSTPQVQNSKNPTWNYPARLVLKSLDISKSFLYVALCTSGPNNVNIPLCSARISLRNLPIGSPKSFKFPLMLTNKADTEACTVRCAATLSSFTPQVYLQPSINRPMMTGGMQQMGGYAQPMNRNFGYY